MRIFLILALALILASCGNYGYHPNYIISQDEPEIESSTGAL